MLLVKQWLTFLLLILVGRLDALSVNTVQDDDLLDNRKDGIVQNEETTTEGTLSAMWHKITNYFAATTAPPEERQKRGVIMVPPETRRGNLHHDVRRMLKRDAGVVHSGIQYAKVLRQQDDSKQVRRRREAFEEEFDVEGERFKDTPNEVWMTEKFSEASDPIENIDKENYMEDIVPFHDLTFRPIVVEENEAN